jgi:hypothetical protein
MGTGAKKDAFANEGTAANLSNQLTANAANIYGGLEPTLQAEAAHPAGYSPTQKAAINTAAQQSAGGGTAGAIGAGRLYAARTRNAGGAKSAIGEGIENAGKNLSNAAVGTEVENANLAQKKQQEGISGLQGLETGQLNAGENALGLSNQALGIANNAKPSYWQQMALAAGTPIAKGFGDAETAALFGGG